MPNDHDASVHPETRMNPRQPMLRRLLERNAKNTEPDQPPNNEEHAAIAPPTRNAMPRGPERDARLVRLKRTAKPNCPLSLKRGVTKLYNFEQH
jgi:hypothetical protein